MNDVIHGLRECGLTLAYHTIVTLRDRLRRMVNPTTLGVRTVVTRDGRILMVRHRSGASPWSLPGGGVSRGENLAAAALREVREEGGCVVQVEHLLGMYCQCDQGLNNYIAVFVCVTTEDTRPPVGDLEIVDAHFFLPQDLPATAEAGSLRRIAEFRRGLVGLSTSW